MIFDKLTGRVIGRRYHKFFNLGEKEETRRENIDWEVPHVILEKLDGSFITPFMTSDGVLHLGTKMGETDVSRNASGFLEGKDNYKNFMLECIANGQTPIFEWCSRKNRIVLDYPEDRLVLTAIRYNVDGMYLPYEYMIRIAKEWNIEYVKLAKTSFEDALASLNTIEDEGYVVRFKDGHMIKMKGSHYLLLHKTMEHLTFEKDVLRLVLQDKLDDLKPFMADDVRVKLDTYAERLFINMQLQAENIAWQFIEVYDKFGQSKKDFAIEVQKNYKDISQFMFKIYTSEKFDIDTIREFVYNELKEFILKNTSSQGNVDKIKPWIMHLTWEN